MSVKANARAIEGLALETWHLLTTAQRTALRRAASHVDSGRPRLPFDTHGRCLASLVGHRLVTTDRWLTVLGLVVRAAGLAETERQAKRRYAARLRGKRERVQLHHRGDGHPARRAQARMSRCRGSGQRA